MFSRLGCWTMGLIVAVLLLLVALLHGAVAYSDPLYYSYALTPWVVWAPAPYYSAYHYGYYSPGVDYFHTQVYVTSAGTYTTRPASGAVPVIVQRQGSTTRLVPAVKTNGGTGAPFGSSTGPKAVPTVRSNGGTGSTFGGSTAPKAAPTPVKARVAPPASKPAAPVTKPAAPVTKPAAPAAPRPAAPSAPRSAPRPPAPRSKR